MLPGVSISFQNGATNSVVPTPDKTFGLISSAVAVGATFELNTPYLVTSMVDVAALGIVDSVDNHRLYKFLDEFFQEAGAGTNLWIMGVANTTTVTEMFTVGAGGTAPVHTLLNKAKGTIHGIFTVFSPDGTYTPTITNAIEDDVYTAIPLAQSVADSYATTHYAPFFVVLEGWGFTGIHADLTALNTMSNNRVGVLVGDSENSTLVPGSKGAASGILAGRLASTSVQENAGKVRNGALIPTAMYIGTTEVESYNVGALHDLGFITFRTHVGRTGYYFTDDPLACLPSDDYHYLSRRRVIDKSYRLAYEAISVHLLDDLDVNSDGTILSSYAKTIEGQVEGLIARQMTANGELSSTPDNELGVICKIDLKHNITSSSTIKIAKLQVAPKGYGRFIDVPLGFIPVNN